MHADTSVELAEKLIGVADLIIFQRCFEAQGNIGEFLYFARKLGKHCLAEMDDLVLPEFINDIGSVAGGEWNIDHAMSIALNYEQLIRKADGCIVSTPILKNHIEKTYKLPVFMIRNKISVKLLRQPKIKTISNLRLIYASGTYSHKEDFDLIEQVVYEFLIKYPMIKLSILGAAQVSERILALQNVSNYPLLPYDDMLQFISEHDLMLVPLVDNIFNQAKSNVKFVECGAVGVPILASRVGEFDHAITHKKNGLLASTPADWQDAIQWLVENPMQLPKLALEAYHTVEAGYLTSMLDVAIDEIIN
jgi:glycosyltransferase involved in cell wall biosynthesis